MGCQIVCMCVQGYEFTRVLNLPIKQFVFQKQYRIPPLGGGIDQQASHIMPVTAKEDSETRDRGKNVFGTLAVGWAITAPSATGRADHQRDLNIPEYTREFNCMVVQLIHAE